ncbi:MAG: site-specific DNA-methyltransferase [Planctomycetaceae bacterium]|jgi:DNA modification methylase|nr:site-specific DNA-methyltransferase [Planctomycetaceae bacterium]
MSYEILLGNCIDILEKSNREIDFTFLDPPFNQQKDYALHNDDMPEQEYWNMVKKVCRSIYKITNKGGCIYFMQREKNTEFVLQTLRETGWNFQNLIIWKKRTSAVPVKGKYGKQYQIIVYAIKGERAKTFHRLRIDPELPLNYKYQRDNGIFVTDVWDDIRELTSGYFAGDEALRTDNGERFHKQQAPLALLLRMILTSTNIGDTILDPFAGTGTTAVTAIQTQRYSIAIEIDPKNIECIKNRLKSIRDADNIQKYYKDYTCTENLREIWSNESEIVQKQKQEELTLFNAAG